MTSVSAPSSAHYFCCGSCNKTFPGGWQPRDEHCNQTGHAQPVFECARCPEWFKSQNDVDMHMETENHWPYLCQFCELSWPLEDQCVEHEAEEHPDGAAGSEHSFDTPTPTPLQENFPPPVVTMSSTRISSTTPSVTATASYQSGKKTAKATKPAAPPPERKGPFCYLCNRAFNFKRDLREHNKSVHDKYPRCRECGMKFNTKGQLRSHYTTAPNHGADCPYCKQRYRRASVMCAHLEAGMCQKRKYLDHFGLYRYIRLKDPFENLAIQLPDWDGEVRYGNDRPFFYHCPGNGCARKFRTLVGVISHCEVRRRSCNYKPTYHEVQRMVVEKIVGGHKILQF